MATTAGQPAAAIPAVNVVVVDNPETGPSSAAAAAVERDYFPAARTSEGGLIGTSSPEGPLPPMSVKLTKMGPHDDLEALLTILRRRCCPLSDL